MHSGLLAYFGDATRPHAKWLSLARVLADPGAAGAQLRRRARARTTRRGICPGRVAVPPVTSARSGTAPARSPDRPRGESAEALAERLAAAVPGSATGAQVGSSPASGEAEAAKRSESRNVSRIDEPEAKRAAAGEPGIRGIDEPRDGAQTQQLDLRLEVEPARWVGSSGSGRELADLQRLLRDWTSVVDRAKLPA